MIQHYLAKNQMNKLLETIQTSHEVILFTQDGINKYQPERDTESLPQILGGSRSGFSAKSFFLPVKELLAEYGSSAEFGKKHRQESSKPFALVNLRSCDVQAIRVLDQVFLKDELIDPFYEERRNNTLIVSVDCREITDFCFCHVVGYEPFVREGMGLNLTPLRDGYVIRADTPQAEGILKQMESSLCPLEDGHTKDAAHCHETTWRLLEENHEKFQTASSYHDIMAKAPPSEKWNDLFNTCVECAACTNVCPTCFCFFMFDREKSSSDPKAYQRYRFWDSCLLADYSRMAGVGGFKPNPRPRIRTRYENRFRHKYLYHYETYGHYGCTGCGRCSQACLGSTDPREVMRVLST